MLVVKLKKWNFHRANEKLIKLYLNGNGKKNFCRTGKLKKRCHDDWI